MTLLTPDNRRPLFAATVNSFRLVLFAVLAIGMMVADHRYHQLEAVRNVLATCIYPLQYIIQVPAKARYWLTENLASRTVLVTENAELRRKQLFLGAELQKLTALEAENRRLRTLLESSVNHQEERFLIAELLQVDFDPYRHQILLNRGARHGIHAGQPILDQQGIIGQISEANALTSRAILITDPNHALPVQIVRTGMRTLALGTGNFQSLQLSHILNNEDIRVGDVIVTSGLDGRFPQGYPVATVTKVEFDPTRPFAHISARPSAQLDRLREVLLLVTEPADGTTPKPGTRIAGPP